MWVLIECDDPAIGPGHDEKRRIIFLEGAPLDMPAIASQVNRITYQTTALITSLFNGTSLLTGGMEVHSYTPGEGGYHCPICHKDVPPKFPPIPKGALPGKIKIDKKDLDKLSELDKEHH